MSYDLLRGLYLGAATNADLTSYDERIKFHVRTDVDRLIPDLVRAGRDVVLTGNPGDGKSHIVRYLQDRQRLPPCEVELDLSATSEERVIARWRAARAAGRPLILCGNEGPLKTLVVHIMKEPDLAERGREIRGQLGRLVMSSPDELPPPPRQVVVIDLADRALLSTKLIADALRRVTTPEFLPEGANARETSAGRNIDILGQASGAPERLARVIALAGLRSGEHISFRQLWAGLSFAICAGKAQTTLRQELGQQEDELGFAPLDNLMRGRGQGALLRAARAFADPAELAMPQLDEDLWARGAPANGEWEADFAAFNPPASWWAQGYRAEAVERFRSLKRLVTLFHSAGDSILDALEASQDRPGRHSDTDLRDLVTLGLRRLYVSSAEEAGAPGWLLEGVPLWVNHTYQDIPVIARPHVAVANILIDDLSIRRPVRAPWLGDALGPLPEIAWLHHAPSGIALRITDSLLAVLRQAAGTGGPLAVPEPVQRFLARLSGWEESRGGETAAMAVLERPRGALIAAPSIRSGPDGAAYGVANVG